MTKVLTIRMDTKSFWFQITPLNLLATENTSIQLDDSISNDTRDNTTDQPAYAFTEMTTLSSANCMFEPQEQFGRRYYPNDYLLFNVAVSQPENVAYIVDLYTHSSKASVDEPPYHLGYHYIMPNILKKSDGRLELPITCATKHRPLGLMRVEFLKVCVFIIFILKLSCVPRKNPSSNKNKNKTTDTPSFLVL